MDGVHDMGGMHGFGSIPIEQDEQLFKQPWEARMFALNLAMTVHTGGNVDRFRSVIEQMPPAEYLASNYYQRWLYSLLQRCRENGVLTEAEVAAVRAGEVPPDGAGKGSAVPAQDMRDLIMHNQPDAAGPVESPRFAVGERVRGKTIHPSGHTRMPRYVRGKIGEVTANNGEHLFADDSGSLRGTSFQCLYTVRFKATHLWGDSAHVKDSVSLELWESHLEQA